MGKTMQIHPREMALGIVQDNVALSTQHFLLTVTLPTSFKRPNPGQFIMIRPCEEGATLLARPLSIYGYRGSHNERKIELLFRTVGTGTLRLSSMNHGQSVEILGPLGHGFTLDPQVGEIILLCGGMGVAPLTFLAEQINRLLPVKKRLRIIAYYGARTITELIGIERLSSLCSETFITTEDGSSGTQGVITELLAQRLNIHEQGNSMVFACGPTPMLRQLSQLLRLKDIPCQASVEERMACGVGACLSCAVPIETIKDGSRYQRVCTEGPVFNLKDIRWGSPVASHNERG